MGEQSLVFDALHLHQNNHAQALLLTEIFISQVLLGVAGKKVLEQDQSMEEGYSRMVPDMMTRGLDPEYIF